LLQDRSKQPKVKMPSHVWNRGFMIDGKRGQHDGLQQTQSFWSGLLRSVCVDLKSQINCNLRTLSMKGTISTTKEFDMIAEALPFSNIRKLNLSGHQEKRDFSNILINAQKIEHLNIGYCGDLSKKEHAALLHLLHNTTHLQTLKMFYTWFDVNTHLNFPLRAANLCPSLHNLNVSLFSKNQLDNYLYASVGGNVQWLGLTTPESDSKHFISQDQGINMWYDDEIAMDANIVKILLQFYLPNLYPPNIKKPSKISKQSAYDRKNQRRNQYLPNDRTCASCGHVWMKNSIKIQTWEGLQSMCRHNKQKCNQSKHYKA
jgi:hypothetical protein